MIFLEGFAPHLFFNRNGLQHTKSPKTKKTRKKAPNIFRAIPLFLPNRAAFEKRMLQILLKAEARAFLRRPKAA